jgi:hypothetical protein
MTSPFDFRPQFLQLSVDIFCQAVTVQKLNEVIDLTGKLAPGSKIVVLGGFLVSLIMIWHKREPKSNFHGFGDASFDELIVKIDRVVGRGVVPKKTNERKKISAHISPTHRANPTKPIATSFGMASVLETISVWCRYLIQSFRLTGRGTTAEKVSRPLR